MTYTRYAKSRAETTSPIAKNTLFISHLAPKGSEGRGERE
jgi:hypothetical protein